MKNDQADCNLAEENACSVGRTAPLHAETIQTDHAVNFSNDEEQVNNPQPGIVNFEAGTVRSDFARIHEHWEHVRENQSCKNNTSQELEPPPSCISVAEKFNVAAHSAEGFVVGWGICEGQ